VKEKEDIEEIIHILSKGNRFLLITHKDPDLDGIGSMIALGEALKGQGKQVIFFTETPLEPPLSNIKGAQYIIHKLDIREKFDATVTLDCSDINRLGNIKGIATSNRPLINIDHHETNDYFGDLNFVVVDSSSTGELVFKLTKKRGFLLVQL